MAGRSGRVIDTAWLTEHYPRMTAIDSLLDEYEREFGWRPNKQVVYVKANRMGLHKEPVSGRGDKAERIIRWTKEPEMEAWMLEHDHGQRMDELRAAWRERWGFGISRAQVSLFRASHSTQTHKSHGGGRKRKPIGSEYPSKDGYIVIKVAEEATVPMSKDNWVFKHVWVWEQEHGPLPEDHVVFFADGDKRNFDPGNLVAVPRRLVGILNNPSTPKWHDAESLEACVAMAKIKSKQSEIYAKAPRVCGVCGRTFVPDEKHVSTGATRIRTCPECLAAGRKASGRHRRVRA